MLFPPNVGVAMFYDESEPQYNGRWDSFDVSFPTERFFGFHEAAVDKIHTNTVKEPVEVTPA